MVGIQATIIAAFGAVAMEGLLGTLKATICEAGGHLYDLKRTIKYSLYQEENVRGSHHGQHLQKVHRSLQVKRKNRNSQEFRFFLRLTTCTYHIPWQDRFP